MAKAALQHACSECGYTTGKWLGRCPACGEWGTLVEERALAPAPGVRGAPAAGRPLLRLVEVEATDAERIPTGVPELDRVLGGGLVPASLVLVSGDPGIGKSTLLLMALRAMSAERKVVLVTGEESAAQVKLRADRLGGAGDVRILAETNLDEVCATLERERPDVCVVDSVQTLYAPELGSAPGSVAQVREAAGRFLRVAKEQGIATFLVGHVTKEGVGRRPARPRAPRRLRPPLRGRPLPLAPRPARRQEPLRLDERARRLRDDLGGPRGRRTIPRSSSARPDEEQPGSAVVCTIEGTRPLLLEVQALVSPTDLAMPRRVGTGVDPKRLSMIVAVLGRHAGVALGQADVFVNVAGGVRIDEPGADLGVALAIASAARGTPVKHGVSCFGEVGLTGRLRPVSQAERRLAECAKLGFSEVARAGRHRVPWQNAPDGSGNAADGDHCGARCERILGRIRPSSRRSSRSRRARRCAPGSTTSSAPSSAR